MMDNGKEFAGHTEVAAALKVERCSARSNHC